MDLERWMNSLHGDAVTPAGPVYSHEFSPPADFEDVVIREALALLEAPVMSDGSAVFDEEDFSNGVEALAVKLVGRERFDAACSD
jgi:hypothetical protein